MVATSPHTECNEQRGCHRRAVRFRSNPVFTGYLPYSPLASTIAAALPVPLRRTTPERWRRFRTVYVHQKFR